MCRQHAGEERQAKGLPFPALDGGGGSEYDDGENDCAHYVDGGDCDGGSGKLDYVDDDDDDCETMMIMEEMAAATMLIYPIENMTSSSMMMTTAAAAAAAE